jgi:uncharacterized protein (TIGR03437 family)
MMNRYAAGFLALFLLSVTAAAQPAIRERNPVLNSASYHTPGLPGSGVAQGSIFSIFGTGLGPAQPVRAYTLPLPTQLGDPAVSVMVTDEKGVATQAIILYAQYYQINAILPSSVHTGNGTLAVTFNNQTSAPAPVQVVGAAFGIYTFASSGYGQAIATSPDWKLNTIAQTFNPGEVAILWGTGLGPISGDDAQLPPAGNLPGNIKVHVGNSVAATSYQGRSGCCAGLDQIVFAIPTDVQGCHVPVAVEAGGALSNVATIAISATGRTCSDSVMGQDLVDRLAAGQSVRFGYIRLESLIAPVGGGQAGYASTDVGMATFSEYTRDTAGLAEYGISAGYCTVVDCSYGCGINSYNSLSLADAGSAQLNAGDALAIQGPSSASITGFGRGFYGSLLNSSGRFLWSGRNYTVSGTGGRDVGSFSVMARTSQADVTFKGIRGSQTLPLAGDLTVEWTGGDTSLQNGQVTIGGYSGNDNLTQLIGFECRVPLAAQKFTIPAWILSALPPSGSGHSGSITYPQGWLWIGQYNKPTEFQADRLDRGILTDIFYNGLAIYFK